MNYANGEQEFVRPPLKNHRVFQFLKLWIQFYLFVYIFPFPLGVIPWTSPLSAAYESGKQSIVVGLAKNLFGLVLTVMPNGSGDTTYNYVEVGIFIVFSAIAAVVSSVALRRVRIGFQHEVLLRVAIRYYLAMAMLGYGWHKLFPIQFSPLGPDDLISNYGDSSPMGLLWRFMGASTAYQMFAGAAEVVGGLLLMFRRTTLLGALISGGVMVNVVMLNFCFDVPVKLYSSHLLWMALWLGMADFRRLLDFFILNRVVEPSVQQQLRPTNRLIRFSLFSIKAGIVFSIAVLPAVHNWQYMFSDGIWKKPSVRQDVYRVDTFERNGVLGKENDDDHRWVRIGISDSGILVIQYANGTGKRYRFVFDEDQTQMKLTQRGVSLEQILEFKQIAITSDGYVFELSGVFDDVPHRVRLAKTEESSFFDSRDFHWINEFPLNR